MKTITLTLLLLALAAPVQARQQADPHAGHHATAGKLTEGEVRKVDRDAKKLTIRHGEIKHLDMPAMTMVFQVGNAALLDKLKVGDKIRFEVQKLDAGYVVTAVQAAQ